jgi:hypothetical protein
MKIRQRIAAMRCKTCVSFLSAKNGQGIPARSNYSVDESESG